MHQRLLIPVSHHLVGPMQYVQREIWQHLVLVYLAYKEIRILSASLNAQSTRSVPQS